MKASKKKVRKNHVANFAVRYWRLLVFFGISLAVACNDHIFGLVGAIVFGPVLLSGAIASALFVRHLFFRQTLDYDAHGRFFVSAWKRLTPRERVYANLAVTCVLIYVAGHIAAALIR